MPKIPHSIQRPLRYFIALAGAGLFTYLVWHAGPANLWKQLLKLGWGFTLVIAVAGVSHLAKTWAWQMMLGEDRNKMPFARLFGLRLGAEAAGQLGIVGQTLGDSFRISQLSREADMATSLASVTLDRALFVVTGILVTVAGILAALPLLSLSHSAQLCAWIFVFGSLALLVLMLVAMKRRWPFLSGSVRLLGHLPWLKNWVDREFALIESMENALLDFFHHCPKKFWMSLALNLACQCLAVLEVCLILSLLGTNVSFLRALTIEGCTKILNAVGSFNPGNVGTYEGGNMLISRVLSFDTATGLALAVARRLRAFFWTTVGGVCLFLLTAQRKRSKNPRASKKNPGELAGQPQSGSGEKGATFALLLPDSCSDCDAFSAPLARVGALPIVLRTILAAQQKANASRILVVAGSKTRKQLQRCLESTGRLPNSTQWLDAADNSFFEALRVVRGQAANASVVLVDGTSTYHPSLIRLAGEWDCDSGALALTSMGKPVGILVLTSESLWPLSTNLATRIANFADLQTCLAATQSVVAKTVEDDLWQPVHSENDRLLAEKKVDHWLVKPTDGMYARLNRKISVPISRQLIKLPITANMVSLFTLAVGFVSAVFFALGGYWNTLLGAFLCLFASILDGCDGEVARLKLLESDFGCWLETACDYVFYFFLLAGMSIGQWRTSGSATFLAWGGLLLFGAVASFLAVAWQRHRLAAGRPEQLLRIWHSHADSRPSNRLLYAARHMEFMVRRCFFPYALVVFALFGIMNIAFILSVIGANLVWPIALYSSRTFARNGARTSLSVGSHPIQLAGSTLGHRVPICAFLLLLLLPIRGEKIPAEGNSPEPNKFFHDFVGLNDEQIRNIREGKAVAKILDSPTADEAFVFGSVYIHATPGSYLKLASDIDALRKLPNYLAIRKFSDPPQLADLAGFTLEEEDFKVLRNCKAGHCEAQLPTEAMEEFVRSVNWSAPDAADQANRLAQQMALQALLSYEKGGNTALGIYRDKNHPSDVAGTFAGNQLGNTLGGSSMLDKGVCARQRALAAFLRAERARSSGLRLQRECEEMDCAIGVRRDYRTGQTEGSNVR